MTFWRRTPGASWGPEGHTGCSPWVAATSRGQAGRRVWVSVPAASPRLVLGGGAPACLFLPVGQAWEEPFWVGLALVRVPQVWLAHIGQQQARGDSSSQHPASVQAGDAGALEPLLALPPHILFPHEPSWSESPVTWGEGAGCSSCCCSRTPCTSKGEPNSTHANPHSRSISRSMKEATGLSQCMCGVLLGAQDRTVPVCVGGPSG